MRFKIDLKRRISYLYLLSDFISWNMSQVPDNVLQNYIDQIFAKYDRDNSGSLDAN